MLSLTQTHIFLRCYQKQRQREWSWNSGVQYRQSRPRRDTIEPRVRRAKAKKFHIELHNRWEKSRVFGRSILFYSIFPHRSGVILFLCNSLFLLFASTYCLRNVVLCTINRIFLIHIRVRTSVTIYSVSNVCYTCGRWKILMIQESTFESLLRKHLPHRLSLII